MGVVIATNRHEAIFQQVRDALVVSYSGALLNHLWANWHERPRYVFLPYWSTILPSNIVEHFECIGFHATDLPFGRGGSPVQNLISRRVYETTLTAFRMTDELDAGPIYTQRQLSLHGGADEIFLRASRLIVLMIEWIVKNEPEPSPQTGEPVVFQRRGPEQSEIPVTDDLDRVFDHIRMLDADGYPPAFIDYGDLVLEFRRAACREGYIDADVRIRHA